MGRYITVSQEVDVDIDMEDFDTSELVQELERRGAGATDCGDGKDILKAIYEKRRLGKDYQADLDQLIWMSLGKTL
jgi:hypothetical protein